MNSEFVIENIEWVLTIVFMAGGGWAMLKSLSSKIDCQTETISKRFDSLDEKDIIHDKAIDANQKSIAENDKRITVNETKIDVNKSMLSDVLKKVDAIYRVLMGREGIK